MVSSSVGQMIKLHMTPRAVVCPCLFYTFPTVPDFNRAERLGWCWRTTSPQLLLRLLRLSLSDSRLVCGCGLLLRVVLSRADCWYLSLSLCRRPPAQEEARARHLRLGESIFKHACDKLDPPVFVWNHLKKTSFVSFGERINVAVNENHVKQLESKVTSFRWFGKVTYLLSLNCESC